MKGEWEILSEIFGKKKLSRLEATFQGNLKKKISVKEILRKCLWNFKYTLGKFSRLLSKVSIKFEDKMSKVGRIFGKGREIVIKLWIKLMKDLMKF